MHDLGDSRVRVAMSAELFPAPIKMKGRFPRTAAEFQQHGRRVVANCTSCWRAAQVDPEALIQMIGTDGDIYDSFTEITSKLACHFCEAPISRITIANLNEKPFGPVSYDEALIHALEFNAFCKARDAAMWKDPRLKDRPIRPRRLRRFGRR